MSSNGMMPIGGSRGTEKRVNALKAIRKQMEMLVVSMPILVLSAQERPNITRP